MSMPHEWVGAAMVLLDPPRAAQANKSGKVRIVSPVHVEVLDVFCRRCRRSYKEAREYECVLGSQHIGGPRKQPDPLILDVEESWPEPHDPLV